MSKPWCSTGNTGTGKGRPTRAATATNLRSPLGAPAPRRERSRSALSPRVAGGRRGRAGSPRRGCAVRPPGPEEALPCTLAGGRRAASPAPLPRARPGGAAAERRQDGAHGWAEPTAGRARGGARPETEPLSAARPRGVPRCSHVPPPGRSLASAACPPRCCQGRDKRHTDT